MEPLAEGHCCHIGLGSPLPLSSGLTAIIISFVVNYCLRMSHLDQSEKTANRSQEQLEALLQLRAEEIESLHRELEAFSHTISHDLRAPLRAIAGFSDILLESYQPDLPEEAQQLLRRVRRNAGQMARLIEDLLKLHRLSHQPMTQEIVRPAELISQALVQLAPEQKDRDVELTTGNLPSCFGDPELLQLVFFNLLSNALKFTRGRSLTRINLASVKSADLPADLRKEGVDPAAVVYCVADNGVGFDMQYTDNLFGIFQRLHSLSEYEGTGIGLAIVQRIIQRHGGVVWATAAPEKGATFCFTLGHHD